MNAKLLFASTLFVAAIPSAAFALAQNPSDAEYRDASFYCLSRDWEKGTRHADYMDPNQAYDVKNGRSFFWDSKSKTWKDSKSGESVTPKNLRDAMFCCLSRD